MRKFALCLLTLPIFGFPIAPARAQTEQAAKAIEILKQADQAAAKLTAISFQAHVFGEGSLASRIPQLSGLVIAKRGASGDDPKVFLKGSIRMMPVEKSEPREFSIAVDTANAYRLDPGSKTYTAGAFNSNNVEEIDALFPHKYLHSEAFVQEIRCPSAKLDGTEKAEGIDCDVVTVSYDLNGKYQARLFISQKDRLLRRYERLLTILDPATNKPAAGKVVFAASSINLTPQVSDATFKIAKPADYKQEEFRKPPVLGPGGLLATGSQAPEWELPTPDGKTISSKSLRGKVIIMDFWASWCGPCRMAMPHMQKLHEKYKDKAVAVIGIDHGERGPFDAAAFFKTQNYTYNLVIKGNEVAGHYHVTGIPCFYVIDPAGKILLSQTGFDPSLDDKIGELIEQALKKK